LLYSFCLLHFWKNIKNSESISFNRKLYFLLKLELEFFIITDYFYCSYFFIGNKIKKSEGKAKTYWLRTGVFLVLIQLLYFKYFNFFIENFNDLLKIFGRKDQLGLLKIIFPIGISFYSFRMIGYLLDIKNNKLKELPTLLDYSVFVAFFPCIIAGPIDKALPFLNNLKVKRSFRLHSLQMD
jgi:D-alanyl-lipoteichoic acid acyltransferase DltB (MBOAT superfamily)